MGKGGDGDNSQYPDNAISPLTKGAISIPESVTYNNNEYRVVSIGNYAFKGCNNLTTTGLENNSSITSVGRGAYMLCSSLISTGLANNKTIIDLGGIVFYGCSSLTSTGFESNSTIRIVNTQMFQQCNSLTSTGLEKNSVVTDVAPNAFFSCKNLTNLFLENTTAIERLHYGVFRYCTNFNSFVFKTKKIPEVAAEVFLPTTNIYYPEGLKRESVDKLSAFEQQCKIMPAISATPRTTELLDIYEAGIEFTLNDIMFNVLYDNEVDNFTYTPITLVDGVNTISGKYLGIPFEFEVKAHEHNYQSSWMIDEQYHWLECACGNKKELLLHEESKWIVDSDPTCKKAGSQHKECIVCMKILKTEEIKKVPHEFLAIWLNDDINHWYECLCGEKKDITLHTPSEWIVDKEPTYIEKGKKHKECTVCSRILEEDVNYNFDIIYGADNYYKLESNILIYIKTGGNYSKFESVILNDIELDRENYIVREGSTIIELKPEYLNTLPVGKYTLKVLFEGREVITNLYILDKSDITVTPPVNGVQPPLIKDPVIDNNQSISSSNNSLESSKQGIQTSDDNSVSLLISLTITSSMFMVMNTVYKRKYKR